MRRDEVFDIDGPCRVEVKLTSGLVQVHTGSATELSVSLSATDTDDMDITQIGNSVSIVQSSKWMRRSGSLRLVLRVPPLCDVNVTGSSADVELRGPLGEARVRTSSGDVDVDLVERLDVTTASGNARVNRTTGDAIFATASGDVVASVVTGRLVGSLSSGDVRVRQVAGSVEITTASGDVTVERCDGDEIQIRTVSGDISLGLPAGIRVEPELSTLSGRTTLPDPAPKGDDAPRRVVRVRLKSVSGDLRIDRAK
jgi:DUF4097 and DUF4098 domain-containing protein YvlB